MKQNAIFTVVVALLCGVLFGICALNGTGGIEEVVYNEGFCHYVNLNQYDLLGDAIINGHLNLDLEVPDELANMDNPYDYAARTEIAQGGAVPLYWDHAFYQGKYYCYFGVVPALMLYVPYELVTGKFLSTDIAVLVLGLLVVVAASLLVIRIARRYFGNTATTPSIVIALLMVFGGINVAYLGFCSWFYSVPILGALLFTMLGLWFWMGARKEADGGDARLSLVHLALGSFCMALNFGCRPQFMLACFLALPLFWKEIRSERLLFSKRGIPATLAGLVPFVIVLVPLMWYNAARFGSPLDFGSSYNLTAFDMTTYEQKPITMLVLLYWYLIQPICPSSEFPFISTTGYTWPFEIIGSNPALALLLLAPVVALVALVVVKVVRGIKAERGCGLKRPTTWVVVALAVVLMAILASYVADVAALGFSRQALKQAIGVATVEPMFGGYVYLCPAVVALVFLPNVRQILKDKGLWGLCWTMVLFSAIALVFDARNVGANQRYFSDFVWYLMFVAVIVVFALQAKFKSGRKLSTMYALLGVAIAFSAVVGFASFFSPERYDPITDMNPEFYEQVVSVFQ